MLRSCNVVNLLDCALRLNLNSKKYILIKKRRGNILWLLDKIFVVQCTVQLTNQFSRVQATMLKCLLSKFIKFVTSKKITSNLTFKYYNSTCEKTKPFKMIGKQPSRMLRSKYKVSTQWKCLVVGKIPLVLLSPSRHQLWLQLQGLDIMAGLDNGRNELIASDTLSPNISVLAIKRVKY